MFNNYVIIDLIIQNDIFKKLIANWFPLFYVSVQKNIVVATICNDF